MTTGWNLQNDATASKKGRECLAGPVNYCLLYAASDSINPSRLSNGFCMLRLSHILNALSMKTSVTASVWPDINNSHNRAVYILSGKDYLSFPRSPSGSDRILISHGPGPVMGAGHHVSYCHNMTSWWHQTAGTITPSVFWRNGGTVNR